MPVSLLSELSPNSGVVESEDWSDQAELWLGLDCASGHGTHALHTDDGDGHDRSEVAL
jgi:hypothetical protein